MGAPVIAGGFGEPVEAAQRHFRSLLDAMAHPGRIVALSGELPPAPGPLRPASFALVLALVDFETPLWLDAPLRRPPIPETFRFHAGCRITEDPSGAAFALVADPTAMPDLDAFSPGTPEYPDRSTTVLLQVQGLAEGRGARLRGPGIDGAARLDVGGVAPGFWAQVAANRLRFPLGVDLILVGERDVAALPRSTSVETP